ncbi:MAG: MoaD/ThiS family protein [Thermoplasmatales archaeon]|jgi:molybdopterin synthase sulfur carrier subunit|nr:MoaD/ThiS family protein [Candidatus Thermoplasmatota archaeon]MCL6002541.1 MoaD/ThiS family protein [Candidatus Thermoplasmatota archaeon]MDA8054823.1 MoaD/ThiS family protein [Thermoplasmatales archaeon]
MRVHIKYYAKYRDSTGKKEEDLEIGESTVRDLLEMLKTKYPKLNGEKTSLIALNNKFQKDETKISEGDVISVFPPVSGG